MMKVNGGLDPRSIVMVNKGGGGTTTKVSPVSVSKLNLST